MVKKPTSIAKGRQKKVLKEQAQTRNRLYAKAKLQTSALFASEGITNRWDGSDGTPQKSTAHNRAEWDNAVKSRRGTAKRKVAKK